MSTETPVLLTVDHVKKCFHKSDGQDFLVLDDIDFVMHEHEIIVLLGRSGSGKSTLLRIISGLLSPTEGQVTYRGETVRRPMKGIAMVFQNFALLPWLTVLENVELGLEAQGIPSKERRTRALKIIDMIGLDGFESAYPKELSGGMSQRVGFARALVVEPDLLLLDEAFSALDVLTAENLRGDLINLWTQRRTRTKGILLVTHNIEEAALLADRILIFGDNPGHIRADLRVNHPLPRNSQDPAIRALIDDIYTLMTTGSKNVRLRSQDIPATFTPIDLYYRLPTASISEVTGLLDQIIAYDQAHASTGHIDLPFLSDELNMDSDELFPLTEALEVLRFARVSKGDISLTKEGRDFGMADILTRKQLFAHQLLSFVPLAQHIRHTLDVRDHHLESEDFFLNELEEKLSKNEAGRVLRVIIDWGRYAELFAYNYDSGNLSLENP